MAGEGDASPADEAADANAAYDLDCPICIQPFLEPMVTSCGHAFCRHCLQRALCPPDLYEDERRLECPCCRGLVGILEPSERLASLVAARYGADYADRRRADADVPTEHVAAAPATERDKPREEVMKALRKQGGYRTLALNSTLDLSCSGWDAVPACLPELSGLRQLRLEHNLLRCLEHLHLPSLLALTAHHNQIQQIGDSFLLTPQLVRLDLSHCLLTHVDGLSELRCLQTLNLSHNRLATAESVQHLAECAPSLDVINLMRNQLPAPALEPLLALRSSVKVLYLLHNPMVEAVSAARGSYRKFLISSFPHLSYLDDHPVDAPERGAAEAWVRGGKEAEAAERLRQQEERSARVRNNTAYMMEKKRLALERRRAAEAAAAGFEAGTAEEPRKTSGSGAAASSTLAPCEGPRQFAPSPLSLRAMSSALSSPAASQLP